MYDFYYNHLILKYGSNCKLLYTDTDYLLLEIKTEDVYKKMGENLDYYDTTDFPKNHPLHSQKKQKKQNERRVRGCHYLRSGMPTFQDVLNPSPEQRKYQKGKGHDKSCYKKGNRPPKLQRRLIQNVCLQTRNEHAPKR